MRHLRRHVSVALEFDDDQFRIRFAFSAHYILPHQIQVNGQPFGLGLVDQRDSMKFSPQMRSQFGPRVPAFSRDEVLYIPFLAFGLAESLSGNIKARHGDTFLLCAPFVVLALDFQECQVAVHVLPHAYLLANELPVVVADVHVERVGVVIHRVVGGDAFAVYLLHIVVGLCRLQNSRQHSQRHRVLGVDAVHQLNTLHLAKRDRVERRNNIRYFRRHDRSVLCILSAKAVFNPY